MSLRKEVGPVNGESTGLERLARDRRSKESTVATSRGSVDQLAQLRTTRDSQPINWPQAGVDLLRKRDISSLTIDTCDPSISEPAANASLSVIHSFSKTIILGRT
ncbi:Hypothetical protein NTJ_13624 [Nesidiocoris tenuis]|uniref:Uncharacterized protein n=1 Tax=Nesidiocoris tenuis TaxID=355587 RepID=A0ABN7B8V4_9HEMI|nr:Hypothetical protein NTJ_13624 [Nesidiocoris tenuis]